MIQNAHCASGLTLSGSMASHTSFRNYSLAYPQHQAFLKVFGHFKWKRIPFDLSWCPLASTLHGGYCIYKDEKVCSNHFVSMSCWDSDWLIQALYTRGSQQMLDETIQMTLDLGFQSLKLSLVPSQTVLWLLASCGMEHDHDYTQTFTRHSLWKSDESYLVLLSYMYTYCLWERSALWW